MRLALAVLLIVHGACAWSFKEFLSGEWTLERQRGGQVTSAVYSLRPVGPNLEGTYYEFTDQRGAERMNERRVAVTFSDDDGRRGSFQLAKQLDTAADWEADEASQPALRPVFEFDFAPYLGGKSWVSETRCLHLAALARHSRGDYPRRSSDQPPAARPEYPAPAVRGVRARARCAGGSHRTAGGCSSSHSAPTPSLSPTSPRPTAPSPPRPRGSHSATARASLRGPQRAPKRRAYSAGTGCTSCSRSGSPDGATPRPRRRSADRAASARRTRRCASAAARSAAVSRTRTLSHLMG